MEAGNGFAQPAWQAAYPALMAKARANGIALLAVRNSRHFAALWPDVEPLTRDGLVALALVNSMACVVPSGGTRALFGTNPTAFAAPRAGHDPLVFDLATSAIAPGEVRSLRAMPSPSAAKPWRALGGAGQTRQPGERRYRQRERSLQKGWGCRAAPGPNRSVWQVGGLKGNAYSAFPSIADSSFFGSAIRQPAKPAARRAPPPPWRATPRTSAGAARRRTGRAAAPPAWPGRGCFP